METGVHRLLCVCVCVCVLYLKDGIVFIISANPHLTMLTTNLMVAGKALSKTEWFL